MKTIKTILSKTSHLALSLVVGIALAAGITFAAWTATWHDPNDWAQSGKTISAQEIAENFEYLKAEVDLLRSGTTSNNSCTSMYEGWPDIIRCTSPTGVTIVNYLAYMPWSNNYVYYYEPADRGYLTFKQDGTYHAGGYAYNCTNKSVSQLVSSGQGIGVVCGQTVISQIPVDDQICFKNGGRYRCATPSNGGFQWDDDWSPRVEIKGDNIGDGKVCYKNGGRYRCASLSDSWFNWDDDWSPYITLEGDWGNICEPGKEINFCHKNGGRYRCATPSNGGFQWDDDWSPYVTFECK